MTGGEALARLLADEEPMFPEHVSALREEVELMVDALSMVRESLAQLSRDADERSRRDGEVGGVSDAWLLGYAAGKAREAQNMSAIVGALQNSLDVWAARESFTRVNAESPEDAPGSTGAPDVASSAGSEKIEPTATQEPG